MCKKTDCQALSCLYFLPFGYLRLPRNLHPQSSYRDPFNILSWITRFSLAVCLSFPNTTRLKKHIYGGLQGPIQHTYLDCLYFYYCNSFRRQCNVFDMQHLSRTANPRSRKHLRWGASGPVNGQTKISIYSPSFSTVIIANTIELSSALSQLKKAYFSCPAMLILGGQGTVLKWEPLVSHWP